MSIEFADRPHRRWNVLTGEWLLVSPHRAKRPWLGQVERISCERPAHDSDCYLCPGSRRANGALNPLYENTFAFTNDFAALLPGELENPREGGESPFFKAEPVRGTCRVICFSPRHDLTLAEMGEPEIRRVVEEWSAQAAELGREYSWVQVFENKGEAMGCSNPHPHGQIWASDSVPNEPAKEDRRQREHLDRTGLRLLEEYARHEIERMERVVVRNSEWLAVVPFWAVWPFETLLLPLRPAARFPDLDEAQRDGLASVLKELLVRYDNLFETPFPYSMGWHGAPFGSSGGHWLLHAHFYPPLLRSATVRKFMVGYELLSEPQRDLTPEQAAARLREVPSAHYKTLKCPNPPADAG